MQGLRLVSLAHILEKCPDDEINTASPGSMSLSISNPRAVIATDSLPLSSVPSFDSRLPNISGLIPFGISKR